MRYYIERPICLWHEIKWWTLWLLRKPREAIQGEESLSAGLLLSLPHLLQDRPLPHYRICSPKRPMRLKPFGLVKNS